MFFFVLLWDKALSFCLFVCLHVVKNRLNRNVPLWLNERNSSLEQHTDTVRVLIVGMIDRGNQHVLSFVGIAALRRRGGFHRQPSSRLRQC